MRPTHGLIYAQVPIDAGSLAEPFFAPDAKAFMHDAKAFGALSHSVKVDAAMAGQYDAVCLCGGHGTCVDFYGPAAAALKAVVEGTYAAGKVVGAVCHGPIGLLECTKTDGTPLVAGLEVTCFSDARTSVLASRRWREGCPHRSRKTRSARRRP